MIEFDTAICGILQSKNDMRILRPGAACAPTRNRPPLAKTFKKRKKAPRNAGGWNTR